MENRTSFTYVLDDAQQNTLMELLRDGNFTPYEAEHTRMAARSAGCTVALFKSGKCLIQGKGAPDFVMFTLEPLVLQAATLGYEAILKPEIHEPHMGIDESGKGDFFGPMVIAAAYVDPTLAVEMKQLKVRDSKTITSDSKAVSMGRELRHLLGNRFSIVTIGPGAYNRLYAKMRSVNTLLGWGHARAIENLLEAIPDCPRAISDQFGNKQIITRALLKKGRGIHLDQMHKAESDLAVAAASILAREHFLTAIHEMGKTLGLKIPKGASAAVNTAAVELVRKHGPQVLIESVKCHFKTTDAVLAACGTDRKALPPEGQVTSRPVAPGHSWHRHKPPASGTT
jgi:ribonuclease HIII